MRKLRIRTPSPTMVIAVIALIAALGGSAYAGSKISFGELSKKAKAKTQGVGPLTYVSSQQAVPPTGPAGLNIAASCPANTVPIGGGIRVSNDAVMIVNDSHPVTGGWAGTVFNGGAVTHTATVSVACATSRDIEGTLAITTKN